VALRRASAQGQSWRASWLHRFHPQPHIVRRPVPVRVAECWAKQFDSFRKRAVRVRPELREEGLAERFLEINGVWEDHVRYGFTYEEWLERKNELGANWLER
jgi:hypothetical protein